MQTCECCGERKHTHSAGTATLGPAFKHLAPLRWCSSCDALPDEDFIERVQARRAAAKPVEQTVLARWSADLRYAGGNTHVWVFEHPKQNPVRVSFPEGKVDEAAAREILRCFLDPCRNICPVPAGCMIREFNAQERHVYLCALRDAKDEGAELPRGETITVKATPGMGIQQTSEPLPAPKLCSECSAPAKLADGMCRYCRLRLLTISESGPGIKSFEVDPMGQAWSTASWEEL